MTGNEFLGVDLNLGFYPNDEGVVWAAPYSHVDLRGRERKDLVGRETDLSLVSGRANLIQALIVRIKTERGELGRLAHPNYGSRHHRLVGEPNTETNRNLIKLHILECLRQEPRIEEILSIEVTPVEGRERRSEVSVRVSLRARRVKDPLILVVPFEFDEPVL